MYPTYKTKKDGLKVLHFLLLSIWILFTDLDGAAEEVGQVENQGAAGVNEGKNSQLTKLKKWLLSFALFIGPGPEV